MTDGALPGFRDFYPEDLARRSRIFHAWREVARRYAFVEYDGPPLEPLDLYTRKSGDEIVGQLYNFTDKGGREVALRPEMTPTFARMVSARANALRKPVRWFSIPQLFRYERAQRGRLREHFQLNVDIVGEPSELADAELLAVSIDIMRELGLGPDDVRARVSDRRLLNALLAEVGVADGQLPAVYGVLDKFARQPHPVSREKLVAAGLVPRVVDRVMNLPFDTKIDELRREFGAAAGVAPHLERFGKYFAHLDALGVMAWVDLDLSIVRGLAYYTGTVFELFDARGELRAICGGGRYDTLLASLGGTDLPALGFGMGDVVLGELLEERNIEVAAGDAGADFYLIGGNGALEHPIGDALRLARRLRDGGFSVDYALNAERYQTQPSRNQFDGARKSGARAAVYFESAAEVVVHGLARKVSDAPRQAFDAALLLDGHDAEWRSLRQWYGERFPSPGGSPARTSSSD
jgi:histidyl-tRNA synthetase